jgi:Type I phosphodiesterase / nucleotide pyrophosphatase
MRRNGSRDSATIWRAYRSFVLVPTTLAGLFLLTVPLLSAAAEKTQTASQKSPATSTRKPAGGPVPRLVVVVVIDQFRSDYLDRFSSEFGDGGFRRLEREGASFRQCFYSYAITETGPGHATIATGTTPDRHGIGANEWFDRLQSKLVYAVGDDGSPTIGGAPGQRGVSPRNLLGSTLSDEMRLASGGRSRAFGVALKDRSAILSVGHGANGAYWYDAKSGNWVTSVYYRNALPEYIGEFNRKHPVPQPLADFPNTAASIQTTVELAETLLQEEKLGAGTATDFLFVGFSANDYAGHRWGPYSKEVEKLSMETDRILAGFLQYLDAHIGRGNYWLALSADHGVAPTLAQARDASMARLEASSIDRKAVKAAIEKAISDQWGAAQWLLPGDDIYFDPKTLSDKNVRIEEAVRVAGNAARRVPGVWGYFSRYSTPMPDSIAEAYRRSDSPVRRPDIQVIPYPFGLPDAIGGGTTHGTPFTYDTQVPLIIVGAPFLPGEYYVRCSPADLAVTLAAMLRVHAPALANGRVLTEALRSTQGSAQPGRLAVPR